MRKKRCPKGTDLHPTTRSEIQALQSSILTKDCLVYPVDWLLLKCVVCSETLPVTKFTKTGVNSRTLRYQCNRCRNAKIPRNKPQSTAKHCRTCKVVKSGEDFHVNRRQWDGRMTQCKVCVKEESRRYYERNSKSNESRYSELRERTIAIAYKLKWRSVPKEDYNECGTCKMVKPLDHFHRESGTGLGYRATCKACCKQRAIEKSKELENV